MSITGIVQASLFDYNALDIETRIFVLEKAAVIQERLKRTARDIIAIGQDLIEVKARLQHGQFQPWLQSEFGMNYRSAVRFMHVAERFRESDNLSLLPVSVLYELAAPSTPDTVVEQVATGQISPTIPAIREARQEAQAINLVSSPALTEYIAPYPGVDENREIKREQAKEHIAALKEKGVELPTGKYSCLIVDPPWTMQKIERDVRPNQVEFDYPTMDEEELKAFPLPDFAADDCHLYLWTTQKHLPLALRLAEHWGFKYQCLMTWVKNVGFTPYSWMYSTEHILFCRKGNLPLLKLGVKLHFNADVREHSRKPDEFYDIVREVSPGPRLDVFSREKREGFDQHGNEVGKYVQ